MNLKLLVFTLLITVKQSTNDINDIVLNLAKDPEVDHLAFRYSNQFADLVNRLTEAQYRESRSAADSGLTLPARPTNVLDELDQLIADFNRGKSNVDATLPIDAIISKYGYPVEVHNVTTEDGYQLTLFRIPGDGEPVLLMHGLLCSSDDYILAGPDNALAYLLADEGYDVWMGNVRGNKHSRRHITVKPVDASFWDFSWHEFGIHDLPAMIDYILVEAGKKSLKYVAHSQGNTILYVMMSEKPEYNKKVSLAIALSPVASLNHVRSPLIRLAAPLYSIIYDLIKHLGVYEFLPDNRLIRAAKSAMCNVDPLSIILCSNFMFVVTGYDVGQLNVTNFPVIVGHTPAGASTKQIIHFAQMIMSKMFRKFDYGVSENRRQYGTNEPPSYNLGRVTIPVRLMYADADWLTHPMDVKQLRKKLKNVREVYKVPYEKFAHLDFLYAKDVKSLVNNKIIEMLHNNNVTQVK